MIDGRFGELGSEGLEEIDGVDGRVVGIDAFGKLPAPPNDGREPPIDGSPPEFPPKLGVEGRALTLPNEGLDGAGLDMLGVLGLDMLGALGRDMFGILGRAPPPPMLPIDGLAPPPPMDGLPPPPPRPRCANAMGDQTVPIANERISAVIARLIFFVNMELLLVMRLGYLPAAGGSFATVI